MNNYMLLFLFSVFISSISQIILKKSANEKHESKLKEYLNIKVIFAYSLFFFSSLLTIISYKNIPLSYGPVLESTGYIYIAVLGYFTLGEKMTKKQLLGFVFVFLGVLAYGVL